MGMRTALAVGTAAAAVLAAAVPAAGEPAAERRVSADYRGSGVDGVMYLSGRGSAGETHSVTRETRRGEAAVQVSLADDSGLPVLAAVVQHVREGADGEVELGRVCGTAPKRFALPAPGRPVTVYLLAGHCGGGPSVPTAGTVELTFRAR